MDGRYNGIPFAFMDHNSFPITGKNPSEDLKLLLTSLLSKLTKKLPKHKRKPFMINKLKDLRLLVGGGTVSGTIREREAYSLLRNPNQFICDRLKLILEHKYVYLFNELHHRTVIINPVVFETSDDDEDAAEYHGKNTIEDHGLRVYYDCESKIGFILVQWGYQMADGDLGYIKFHSLSTKEDGYQWTLLQDEIRTMKNKIDTSEEELQQLNNALSLISSKSFYIPSSSIKSIFSYESTGNDNENDGIVKFKLVQLEKDLRNNVIDFRSKYTPQIFVQKLSSTMTTNLGLFLSKLKAEYEYSPFGEQLLGYELTEHESSYFIHRINQQNLPSNSKFFDWYNRLQTFLMFFIDIVPSTNKSNLKWIVYIVYQQYKNDNSQISYTPIGFTKVYLYYVYPDKTRPQICEMLILPPYQRKGHGRRLLTAIYEDLRTNSRVQDITAEDPSDEFVALRDLVSLELCHKYLPDLFSKESILKTNRATKEVIDKAREVCKLTKQETRRVHEMCLLQSINHNGDKQMRRFRLLVKQRLLELLKRELQDCIPVRPIENTIHAPTTNISNYLDEIIRPIFDKECQNTTIIDGASLIQALHQYMRKGLFKPTTLFCTLDIRNLYTMLPQEEALNILVDFLHVHGYTKVKGISLGIIRLLASIILKENVFFYGKKIYQQVLGGAMGSSFTLTLANIFMWKWQKELVRRQDMTGEYYGRYIDDVFMTWNKSENELKKIIENANTWHPNIKLEYNIGKSLLFLDVLLTNINGALSTSAYHKPAAEPYIVPFISEHPRYVFDNIVQTSRRRAIEYSSTLQSFNDERRYIKSTFLYNDYPSSFIDKTFRKFFSDYISSRSFLPFLDNEAQFIHMRIELSGQPSRQRSKVEMRITTLTTDNDHLIQESDKQQHFTIQQNQKPNELQNKLIIHYTHEKRFNTRERGMHRIFQDTFVNTPIIETKLIVGNTNRKNTMKELIRKRPPQAILKNKVKRSTMPEKNKTILQT
ncbi:unnamed protein product [Rotaria magnacalcarata]|uniref:Reverse transcriptase domain-containing protein n=2 Tax=Rotaria magnacalcarata TaxID=392030 RepID=A0A815ZAF7_9BILA|nr:unnamed protein product [Rotaria magnacalcarata]